MMELNDIKKALYKQNPEAVFQSASKSGLLYIAIIGDDEGKTKLIRFLVPYNDLGDAVFGSSLHSKLLIRWIVAQ